MMIYQWRDGFRFKVDPDQAAKVFERIREAHDGSLQEEDVVKASRPKTAVLHDCFEWDDAVAAKRHREEQARFIIRSLVEIRVEEGESEPRKIMAYVHVKPEGMASCYMPTSRVMNDEALRAQAIANALALLNGVKRRYEHLVELKPVFAAIDRASAKLGNPKGKITA